MIFRIDTVIAELTRDGVVIATYNTMLECAVKAAIAAHESGAELVCQVMT